MTYINKYWENIKMICINLRIRKDKKKYMISEFKKQNFKLEFYKARLNSNPKKGCLKSHLTVINNHCKSHPNTNLLILEDDVKFLKELKNIPEPPKDWDMLYLGGTVKDIFDYSAIRNNSPWVRMCCWTTHAYIINVKNNKLIDTILKAGNNYDKEIDTYYIEEIHRNFNCYMCNPMMIIQKEDYSDIENARVNYNFMQDTLKGFQKPDHEEKDGDYVLKLDNISDNDLPMVSIITPTYCRRKMFSVALHNFQNFVYPANKLEWIIIDDTPPESKDTIEDILPTDDKRIKYYQLRIKDSSENNRFSIAQKRNIGVEKASHEIIVHMDDDDYYPEESILCRVKTLLKYKDIGIGCVGCSEIGIYDIESGASQLASDGNLTISEASMAYFKEFWKKQKFDNLEFAGEYKSFIQNRFDKIMDVPYAFIIIALSHGTNYTGNIKSAKETKLRYRGTNDVVNFYDLFDDETQLLFYSLKKIL